MGNLLKIIQISKKHKVSINEVKKQLAIGYPFELEHKKQFEDLGLSGKELQTAIETVVLTHLDEKIDYYALLKKVENKGSEKPDSLNEQVIREVVIRGEKVVISTVNRNYINLHHNSNFTMGGHHFVSKEYKFIPDGKVYIDQDLDETGREATIKHELTEYELMKYEKMSYEKAHEIALKAEVPILKEGLKENTGTIQSEIATPEQLSILKETVKKILIDNGIDVSKLGIRTLKTWGGDVRVYLDSITSTNKKSSFRKNNKTETVGNTTKKFGTRGKHETTVRNYVVFNIADLSEYKENPKQSLFNYNINEIKKHYKSNYSEFKENEKITYESLSVRGKLVDGIIEKDNKDGTFKIRKKLSGFSDWFEDVEKERIYAIDKKPIVEQFLKHKENLYNGLIHSEIKGSKYNSEYDRIKNIKFIDWEKGQKLSKKQNVIQRKSKISDKRIIKTASSNLQRSIETNTGNNAIDREEQKEIRLKENIDKTVPNSEQSIIFAKNNKTMKKTDLKYKSIPEKVKEFMPLHQQKTVNSNIKEFQDAIENLVESISKLPITYETEGQGDKAIAYLHYFHGSQDWYITEQDMEKQQIQAMGLVNMFGDFELGYVNIEELKASNKVELDFHWTPKSLGEIKKGEDAMSIILNDKDTVEDLLEFKKNEEKRLSTTNFKVGDIVIFGYSGVIIDKLGKIKAEVKDSKGNRYNPKITELKQASQQQINEFVEKTFAPQFWNTVPQYKSIQTKETKINRTNPELWQDEVYNNLIELAEISRGDAQGLVEAYEKTKETLTDLYNKNLSAKETAKLILKTPIESKPSHREPNFKEGDKVKVVETGNIETIESIGAWDEEANQYRILWTNDGVGYESDVILFLDNSKLIIKTFEFYKGIDFKYENQYQKNKAIEELVNLKVKHEIITTNLMNRVEITENTLTSDETIFINSYTGMGGLDKFGATGQGILYEFYTPDEIIKMMWALAYKYGNKISSVLEPSVGVGRFFKYAKNEIATGYELNLKSAIICKILYPNTIIYNNYFEQIFIKNNNSIKNNTYTLLKHDLVIGNPPYGDISGAGSKWLGMGEQKYTGATNYIDYFIFRGLDLLVSQGLLIFIVGAEKHNGGKLFLEKGTSNIKEAIAEKCDLVDAYKLPAKLFQTTDVSSEIIVLRKKS